MEAVWKGSTAADAKADLLAVELHPVTDSPTKMTIASLDTLGVI